MKKFTKINIILFGLLIAALLFLYLMTHQTREGWSLIDRAMTLSNWLDKAKHAMSAFSGQSIPSMPDI
jgi:hypothetical protein